MASGGLCLPGEIVDGAEDVAPHGDAGEEHDGPVEVGQWHDARVDAPEQLAVDVSSGKIVQKLELGVTCWFKCSLQPYRLLVRYSGQPSSKASQVERKPNWKQF